MKNHIILLLTLFLVVFISVAEAKNEEYEIVSKLSNDKITLYAKKKEAYTEISNCTSKGNLTLDLIG